MLTPHTLYMGGAIIRGPYRYRLTRWWGGDPRELLWVMLNPSVADSEHDDPTIKRVRGFSRTWGFPGFTVVNLYAEISTDPAKLGPDPIGPENDRHILEAAGAARRIVCAWGSSLQHRQEARAHEVVAMLAGRPLFCLGTTAGGHPRHPLYLPGNQPLVEFRMGAI